MMDTEISNSIDIIDESTSQDHASDGPKYRDLESDGQDKKRSNSCFRSRKEILEIKTPFGFTIRGKGKLRAAVQSFAFGALLLGYCAFHIYSSSTGLSSEDEPALRLLGTVVESDDDESEQQLDEIPSLSGNCDKGNNPWWMVTLYIIGILYMFLALAIVCDEFFVPALEEISGPHRMNLSMDVAGKLKSKPLFPFFHSKALSEISSHLEPARLPIEHDRIAHKIPLIYQNECKQDLQVSNILHFLSLLHMIVLNAFFAMVIALLQVQR